MLENLKNFLADLTGGAKHPARFADNDYRLAAAALLVHAASIDGEMTAVERDKLQAVLKHCFELDDAATRELHRRGDRSRARSRRPLPLHQQPQPQAR